MTIGARELVEGVQKSVLIAEQNSIEVNATAQENIAEENNIEVPCWYTFLGIPPARAAQLHSEAQEAQELHQELQELQEVHQKLQSEVQEQESATADTRGEGHGRYVVQAFSNCPFPLLRTGMASRRRRRNGIKKSKHPDKTFKLGKFVSREFKWDSVRQHRFYSANYMMLRQPMGCPICGLHDLSELCCEWLSAHCIDSLIRN
jgi:hypothetical protein